MSIPRESATGAFETNFGAFDLQDFIVGGTIEQVFIFALKSKMREIGEVYGIDKEDKPEYFPHALSDFGGCNFKLVIFTDTLKPKKLICYSDVKNPFVAGKGLDRITGYYGKHWVPQDLWGDNNTVASVNRWYWSLYNECCSQTSTIRIESRYLANQIGASLIKDLEEYALKCYNENFLICLDSEKYFMYLQCRQKVLLSLAAVYKKRIDAEALSALALCAYMLSSQVIAPNAKLYECRKFVNRYRRRSNVLCFLPNQFKVVNSVVSFRGRLAKKYLDKQFPKAKLLNVLSRQTKMIVTDIKSPELVQLVGKFSSLPRNKSEIGTHYNGPNLFNSRESVVHYAKVAREIFDKHGLGAQGAGRFLQLFWEEYMLLVRDHWVDPEYKKSSIEEYSLGFECFGYDNNVKTTPYKLSNSLSFLLPEIETSDIGDIAAIEDCPRLLKGITNLTVMLYYKEFMIQKIKMTKAWEMFGSRGAYLQLALNQGVSLRSLTSFRKFFLLATHSFMECIPLSSGQKFLVGEKGLARFQRTIGHSKQGDQKPRWEEGTDKNSEVMFIRETDELVTAAGPSESNKRRRVE
ncbi:hypothetical protein MFLAVUS_011298 [Mucor flavus]|uniref:Uncharacterized protein n=1 Tax=Mucor flavus TaxID=439312 RepID=A0ABP9ZF50_9FUNG